MENEMYFVYNEKKKQIRLQKMRHTGSGSGNEVEALADLCTGKFKANWCEFYYDADQQIYKRYGLPAIAKTGSYPNIYLEGFRSKVFSEFLTMVEETYEEAAE